MDRLLLIDPTEVVLRFEVGQSSSASVKLQNVMYTMPVAFKVQPSSPTRYTVKPSHGIIPPLGTITFQIILHPSSILPEYFPRSPEKFVVKSVVVPGGNHDHTISLDWFTAKKKQVFSDHGLRLFLVGNGILMNLVTRVAMEDIREVLERDSSLVNGADECGRSPLHVAVKMKRPELVQLLLEFATDLELRDDREGMTPLQVAASQGDALAVELLLAKGSHSDAKTLPAGWTSLHYAATQGSLAVMSLLIENGANVDSATADGRRAIHMAVAEGRTECVKMLVSHGATLDARGQDGETPLHIAASIGDLECVRMLVESGANPHIRDKDGKTPLDRCGRRDMMDMLGVGDYLRLGARKGLLKIVEESVQRGAWINGKSQDGWTALHRASFKGFSDVVTFLLDRGADLELQDQEGYTPLHCAIEAAQKEIVGLLLRKGANVNARNKYGATPLQLATSLKQSGLIKLLLSPHRSQYN